MRVLFICNTYMQLIIAMHMKRELYPDDESDLLLSDHSRNADTIASNLVKTGLFNRVEWVQTRHYDYEASRLENIEDAAGILLGRSRYSKILGSEPYDEICFYNMDMLVYSAFESSKRKLRLPKCTIFEEGLFSYRGRLISRQTTPARLPKSIKLMRKLIPGKDMFTMDSRFLCFYPELIDRTAPYITDDISFQKLPPLRPDKAFISTLNSAFSYDPSARDFPQKYIYFATSTDIDGNPVGETELVLKLAELTGRDNLLVKVHPRDTRDIYEQNGLTVSRDSSIPWEVIQLNHDFSSHVLISLSSGSIINLMAMMNENIPSYFLFPMVKGRNSVIDEYGEDITRTLSRLQEMGVCGSVKITDDLKEVLS